MEIVKRRSRDENKTGSKWRPGGLFWQSARNLARNSFVACHQALAPVSFLAPSIYLATLPFSG